MNLEEFMDLEDEIQKILSGLWAVFGAFTISDITSKSGFSGPGEVFLVATGAALSFLIADRFLDRLTRCSV